MFPDFDVSGESHGIRTIATLGNVKELAIQKIRRTQNSIQRCIGLFICYTDGSKAVLGQWDVSASSTIIYDATKGKPLTSLLFQKDPQMDEHGASHMIDIVANTSRDTYLAQKLLEEAGWDLAPIPSGFTFEWLASDGQVSIHLLIDCERKTNLVKY